MFKKQSNMVELSLFGSNKYAFKKLLAPKNLQSFVASLSRSEQVKLQNYLSSPVNTTKRHHEVSLSNHTVMFSTDTHPASREVVIRDIKVINDAAIKRAKLRGLNRDSGSRNYVIAEEMLKGVEGGKVDLAKRKELGKRLDDKFQFGIGHGRVRDSDFSKYKKYLWMILSTKSGRKLANIRDSGKVLVVLFNDPAFNSSYGHDRIQVNIHPDQSKRYVKAFGRNKFVQLGGIRSLAHELTHAYYRDTGSKSMKEREEIRAMKLANRIMREIYGLDAGERKNYATTSPKDFPDEMIILK